MAEPLFSAQEIAEDGKTDGGGNYRSAGKRLSSRPERYGRRGRVYRPPAALAGISADLRLSPREPLRECGTWRGDQLENVAPEADIRGRVVLVLDDILDEGITLDAIRDWMMGHGAGAFYSAVLVEKEIGRPKPIQADFIGVVLPDRYVFGFGMDINGVWRNLPAIYALKAGAL